MYAIDTGMLHVIKLLEKWFAVGAPAAQSLQGGVRHCQRL